MLGCFQGTTEVALHQQVHALLAVVHASRRVYARSDLEDDVAHGDLTSAQRTDVDDGFQTDARVLIQDLQSVERQYAVLVNHRHDVGSDAHGTQVEQRDEPRERYAVVLGKSLHKLEAHPTAAEVLERIAVVGTLGVEHRHSWRQRLVGHMMVTDNEVDAQTLGIGHLFNGLDATVENDDQLYSVFVGIVYSFLAHTISLFIAVGDIIFDVGIKLLQKPVDKSHSRAAVNIIVAIDQNALLAAHSIVEPVDRHIHVLHEERVVKVGKLRMEEPFSTALCAYASPDKQKRQYRADVELFA